MSASSASSSLTPTSSRQLEAPALQDIVAARQRIAGSVFRTPLVRLQVEAPCEIWLKLENLQPIGSFKLRGATNAMLRMAASDVGGGVYTASAGNMAQGLAWAARQLGVPCTVYVPESAPETKIAAIQRLDARIVRLPFDDWWRVIADRGRPGETGRFVHPFADRDVMAGNGTIALEILEDLQDVDAVLVPFGGGGLACGIAAAMLETAPGVRVFGCEVETAAPLAASFAAGRATPASYTPTFVDGIGSKGLLPEMWPLAHALLSGALVSSPSEIAAAVRLLIERSRIVAEGAGAAGVAAALAGRAGAGRVVCVVSGGNIDLPKLGMIVAGSVP